VASPIPDGVPTAPRSRSASCCTTGGCEYVRLLRPSVLKQLNPRVVRLVNELPPPTR
jgi:hypothetical protein